VTEGDGVEQATGIRSGTPDVFVSYASQDAAVTNSIVENLEQHGLRCWIAPRDVVPGSLYADEIVRAINDAKVLVLVLSEHAVASPHVGKEIERASSKRRRIIVLRIDSAPLTLAFEYFLSESQWIDLGPGGVEVATAKLVEAAQRHLEPTAVRERLSHSDEPAASRPIASRARWMVTGGLAVLLALACFVVDRFSISKRVASERPSAAVVPPHTPTAPTVLDKSIAVLPFIDMSEKKDQEYFADGMAEEILDLVAKIPGIRVIGRTSSFQFKDKAEDLRKIGKTLDVAYVLEGSVRKSGERMRVTAQLIGTHDGSHVWSGSYDEAWGDVLKVQDEIASGLARALQVTIGADDLQSNPILMNLKAYDLYLRGRHAYDRFDKEGFETAAAYLQQALNLDPSLIRASEWLAMVNESAAEWAFVPPREGYERTRASVQRAIALNPRSGIGHSILSIVDTIYDWDWSSAAAEAKLALNLEPHNALVLSNISTLSAALGQLDETARLTTEALALDPLNAGWHQVLGYIRYRTGRLAEAEAEMRKTLQISPSYATGHYSLGLVLLDEGKLPQALAEIQQEPADGSRDAGLSMVYHAMRRRSESDAATARLVEESADDAAYEVAVVYAYRGEVDKAFAWLDRAYSQKDVELYWIKRTPGLKTLGSDPRYTAFLRKMKLPE
jgi:TolB-like protein/Tfp pilus assembly protein PilF